jgi:hypothetical protein
MTPAQYREPAMTPAQYRDALARKSWPNSSAPHYCPWVLKGPVQVHRDRPLRPGEHEANARKRAIEGGQPLKHEVGRPSRLLDTVNPAQFLKGSVGRSVQSRRGYGSRGDGARGIGGRPGPRLGLAGLFMFGIGRHGS